MEVYLYLSRLEIENNINNFAQSNATGAVGVFGVTVPAPVEEGYKAKANRICKSWGISAPMIK